METTQKRIEELDMLKGYGIVCMVLGHIYLGWIFDKYIHSFHMPLFFIVSGFLYSGKNGMIELIKKRSRTLIVPYLLFGIPQCIIWYILYGKELGIQPIFNYLLFNTEEVLPIAGSLWFLTSLFFTEILYAALDRLINNGIVIGAIVLLLFVFGGYYTRIVPLRLPWAIDTALIMILFYYLGRMLRQYKTRDIIFLQNYDGKIRTIAYVTVFLISSILIQYNGYVNYRRMDCGKSILLCAINALLSIWVVWGGCILLLECKTSVLKRIGKILQFTEARSLVFLGTNQIVILFVTSVGGAFLQGPLYTIITIICVFCILFIMANPCMNFINKLIGR